jgi:hypothetical protein
MAYIYELYAILLGQLRLILKSEYMFNLFGKKPKPTNQPNELTDFQDTLNKQQKAAILTSLSIVSTSKGMPHQKDLENLIQTSRVLGMDLEDPAIPSMQSKSEQHLIDTLKTLDKGQKEWFIVALHSMVLAKGSATETEMGVAIDICNRIGISDDMYVETIKKTEAIMKRL